MSAGLGNRHFLGKITRSLFLPLSRRKASSGIPIVAGFGPTPDVSLIDAEQRVMFDPVSSSQRLDTPARRFPG
ncbi:hypothetical protein [Pseudomonas umsongensis]|uniref:hypothetical protein n=1 Tax=Pseudomonas umsongensis TaxID=198618 RepID=UPI0012DDFABE|nr:hypothetical protein [Pseudomonas umsongensis]